MFDTLLASQLAGMPPGLAQQGVEIGQAAAAAVLDWRQNDGWPTTQAAATAPDPTYVLPHVPGVMAADTAGEQLSDVYVLSDTCLRSRC